LSLWPNQFVNIRLMLAVRKNAIVVPLAAIQRGTQGSYVFTVKSGKAAMQPVKVDLTQGNIALIATGVAVGDQVVVDGQERLQSGTPVDTHDAFGGSGGGAGGGAGKGAGKNGGNGANGTAPGKDSATPDDSKKKSHGKQG
jgi:multidrug efflux system membrane fusion protein